MHCRELSDLRANRAAAGNAAWRIRSHHSCLTCPCVAPHTAKIHTLITVGISVRVKPFVFKPRKHLPFGLDFNQRFRMNLTEEQKQDLVAFLNSL
jgi:hypothetical protein